MTDDRRNDLLEQLAGLLDRLGESTGDDSDMRVVVLGDRGERGRPESCRGPGLTFLTEEASRSWLRSLREVQKMALDGVPVQSLKEQLGRLDRGLMAISHPILSPMRFGLVTAGELLDRDMRPAAAHVLSGVALGMEAVLEDFHQQIVADTDEVGTLAWGVKVLIVPLAQSILKLAEPLYEFDRDCPAKARSAHEQELAAHPGPACDVTLVMGFLGAALMVLPPDLRGALPTLANQLREEFPDKAPNDATMN